ncbi:MAG: S24/S26 family peptidase [Clostridia bacterium]|nr:S24/S26 family peptidase [Clostridia bacterium]
MEAPRKIADVRQMGLLVEELLRRGDTVRLTVTGNSMYPMLHTRRDTVTLSPAGKIKKYDITFHRRTDGRYILHRVLKIQKDGTYLIAGDNELKPEPPVNREQIFGVVTSYTRWGKEHSVKSPLYWMYVRIWHLLMPWRWKIVNFRLRKYRHMLGEQQNEKSETN